MNHSNIDIPENCVRVGTGIYERYPDEIKTLRTHNNYTIRTAGNVIWGEYDDSINDIGFSLLSDGDGHVRIYTKELGAKEYNWYEFEELMNDVENEIDIPSTYRKTPLGPEYTTAIRIVGNWVIFFDRAR